MARPSTGRPHPLRTSSEWRPARYWFSRRRRRRRCPRRSDASPRGRDARRGCAGEATRGAPRARRASRTFARRRRARPETRRSRRPTRGGATGWRRGRAREDPWDRGEPSGGGSRPRRARGIARGLALQLAEPTLDVRVDPLHLARHGGALARLGRGRRRGMTRAVVMRLLVGRRVPRRGRGRRTSARSHHVRSARRSAETPSRQRNGTTTTRVEKINARGSPGLFL